jgi:asparagine synthase (glutamine-hydrolysing)
MCGIIVLWGPAVTPAMLEAAVAALGARGPDSVRTEQIGPFWIGFTRLQIQGAPGTEQPFVLPNGHRVLVNGEIFNSEILRATLGLTVPEGASDCAVIPALMTRGDLLLDDIPRQLDGDFAIVAMDPSAGTAAAIRDPYGVRPLYWATGPNRSWCGIASEVKAFPADADDVWAVEPGTIEFFAVENAAPAPVIWHQPPWLKIPRWRASLEGLTEGGAALRQALEEAVAKRLTTVREVGACLSGGLDSSLVAAIAARRLARVGKRLHTYSVGMAGSPDLAHARLVAEHIGSVHHERLLTPEECLAAIPAVIRAIESFDITTVRASVGNWMVGALVAAETPTVKVVLNGDGADELLGGYLYMRAAPDDAAFEAETDRLLREIHRYDVARSERSMAAHGLESRSPFLDRQLVAVARGLPTEALRPRADMMEKTILRTAFADTGLLPERVLWRRKEAFSDGISQGAGRSWYEMAREEGERWAAEGGDSWQTRAATYTVIPPPTAEALWYRELWEEEFPAAAAEAVAPVMWMPRFVEGATDPSARTLTGLYAS